MLLVSEVIACGSALETYWLDNVRDSDVLGTSAEWELCRRAVPRRWTVGRLPRLTEPPELSPAQSRVAKVSWTWGKVLTGL